MHVLSAQAWLDLDCLQGAMSMPILICNVLPQLLHELVHCYLRYVLKFFY